MLLLTLSATLTTILIVAARFRVRAVRRPNLGSMGDQWIAANQSSRS